ncbi:tudor domain-containing protein 5 isoform X2 [Lucilia sericata]|nr:tudor domain-containing protein 5 isoform X2 [Lucilia sericata]XP_037828318.1 tudor domain-containing protein 5 isoform X2 [Lucilia sericata]
MEKSALNEVKAILKSLVLSSPEKITIEKLNRDYRDVEGQFIPFRRLGYGNLEEFLRSIPDTLRVFGSGPTAMVCFVANEKSDHIHDMIMKQKKPKSKGARTRARNATRPRSNPPQRSNRFTGNIKQPARRVGQQLSPFQSVNRNHFTKTVQVRDIPQLVKKANYVPPVLADQMLYALPQPSGIVLNTQQNINLQYGIFKAIDDQARKYEEQVRQLNSLLKKQCSVTAPPPKTLSTAPPPPLSRQQTRTVKFSSDINSFDQKVPETKKESLEKTPIVNKHECIDLNPPKDVKQMPIKLSEEVENLLDMPKLYKPTNPIKESSSVHDSSEELQKAEMPPLNKPEVTTEIKENKRFFDDSADKVEDPDEAVPSFAAKNNVFRLDFPEHTVPYGLKIAPYKLSDDVTVGSCIKIFISEIHNPFKFWFHIHKDNHELDQLMYQIERYYSPLEAEDLRIPMMCLTPGQVCAACYNGLWHRAEIVAPPVNTTIKVSFMDYGTVTEVGIENIKFLASYFAQLPAQALRGCLSHIKPRALHWSHEATTYFLTLVAEMMLYAKIVEIDREQNILYMVLCNTNGEDVVQINKSLVEKRYALYNEDWKAQKISQNNGKRIHHPREDFPT